MGSNGDGNILDIQPQTIHDRTQVFLGSVEEIEKLHGHLGTKMPERPKELAKSDFS